MDISGYGSALKLCHHTWCSTWLGYSLHPACFTCPCLLW